MKKKNSGPVTKDDLKNVSKEIISNVQRLLSKQEKNINKLLVQQTIRLESKTMDMEEKFESKLIEFKSDFFEKIDPILKEVTTAREERPLIESRIEALEDIHQKGKHSLTTAN